MFFKPTGRFLARCAMTAKTLDTEDDLVFLYSTDTLGKFQHMYKNHVISDMEDAGDDDVGDPVSICGSDNHILMLTSKGICYGAGNNSYSQIGSRTEREFVHDPIEVCLPLPIQMVSCGNDFSAFVLTSGQLYMSGDSRYGKLGLGPNVKKIIDEPTLVQFPPISNEHERASGGGSASPMSRPKKRVPVAVVQVACGLLHTLAVVKMDDNLQQVYSWGSSFGGTLGHGGEDDEFSPKPIEAPTIEVSEEIPGSTTTTRRQEFWSVKMVCCSRYHSLCVTARGVVFSWGNGKDYKLGHGSEHNQFSPKRVTLPGKNPPVDTVACGDSHSWCVTMDDGDVYGFGQNSFGQLGRENVKKRVPSITKSTRNMTRSERIKYEQRRRKLRKSGDTLESTCVTKPEKMRSDVTNLFCGPESTLMVLRNGSLIGCGRSDRGQLGIIQKRVFQPRIIVGDRATHTLYASTNSIRSFAILQHRISHKIDQHIIEVDDDKQASDVGDAGDVFSALNLDGTESRMSEHLATMKFYLNPADTYYGEAAAVRFVKELDTASVHERRKALEISFEKHFSQKQQRKKEKTAHVIHRA